MPAAPMLSLSSPTVCTIVVYLLGVRLVGAWHCSLNITGSASNAPYFPLVTLWCEAETSQEQAASRVTVQVDSRLENGTFAGKRLCR